MPTDNFYKTIKNFPNQFSYKGNFYPELKLKKIYKRIIICGMGGSALYGDVANDILRGSTNLQIDINRSPILPNSADKDCFFVVSSYSGNTAETLSCFTEIVKRGFDCAVMTSGGILQEEAEKIGTPAFLLPRSLPQRMAVGYFLIGLFEALSPLLNACDFDVSARLFVNEPETIELARRLNGKIPLLYAPLEIASVAQYAKISFNENSKTPAFYNTLPELCHNELEAFEKEYFNTYPVLLTSQYSNNDFSKRLGKLFFQKAIPFEIVDIAGEGLAQTILGGIWFFMHTSYYLAQQRGVEAAQVPLIEKFKHL